MAMAQKHPELSLDQAYHMVQMADGLDVLIRFHDREVDAGLLAGLREHRVIEGLAELAQTKRSRATVDTFLEATEALGPEPTSLQLDYLAAEYADIYLTHAYRAAPSGSVWMTEDKLERQMPMFDVRDWYAHYGISVPNWRIRADDHAVHELQFISHLCRFGNLMAAQDAGRFMDLHMLPWMPAFLERAAQCSKEPFYAALMDLTDAFLEDLRQFFEAATGVTRDVRVIKDLDTQRAPEAEAAPFIPGAAESW